MRHLLRVLIAASILVLSTASSGCMSESEEGFEWPEPVSWDCNLDATYSLDCGLFLEAFDIPHQSVINPVSNELWIVYLSGYIKSWDGNDLQLVADLSEFVNRCHMEQGLLGVAFEDDFEVTGTVLMSYVAEGPCEGPNQSNLTLATISIDSEGLLDPSSISILKEIEQPYRNHNGGYLLPLGDNQYLWGVGDGGGSDDPHQNGQNNSTPLGSILLFAYEKGDISSVLINQTGDQYVLHSGLRNPWRFDIDSYDRLWIADVGQNCYEEINLAPLMESSNFGWSEREGEHRFYPNGFTNEDGTCNPDEGETPLPDGMTDPVGFYPHENGNCSITGGFWMDWGPETLRDGYLYGDFCSGSMWVMREESGTWSEEYIGSSGGMIVGFGETPDGGLLVFHWTGEVVIIG